MKLDLTTEIDALKELTQSIKELTEELKAQRLDSPTPTPAKAKKGAVTSENEKKVEIPTETPNVAPAPKEEPKAITNEDIRLLMYALRDKGAEAFAKAKEIVKGHGYSAITAIEEKDLLKIHAELSALKNA